MTDPQPTQPQVSNTTPAQASAPAGDAGNTPAAASTLLTTPPVAEPAKPAEGTTKTEDATAQSKPAVPDKYDLKLPDGALLDAKSVENISLYAKEKGLTNEQAQNLLERENLAVSSYANNQNAELTKEQDSWVSKVQNDPEIGGAHFKESVAAASRVIEKFGTPAFKEAMNQSRLGDHPEVVRLFSKIGKMMGDDKLVTGGAGSSSSNKSVADMFFPSTAKNN